MTIRKVPVKVKHLEWFCPYCEEGEMTFIKIVGDEQFQHKCNRCGYEEICNMQYPALDFEAEHDRTDEIEEFEDPNRPI